MVRSTNPPALGQVDVPLPVWPAVNKVRRRVDAARSATGRMATLAGAAAAAAGLFGGDVTSMSLLATAVASCIGVATLRLWKPDGHQRAAATVLYLAPGTSLAALLVAERLVAGIHPGEALALTVWTTATWVLRPARVARRMLVPPPVKESAVEVAPVEVVDSPPAARWWTRKVAVDGGTAPGTVLEDIERTGEQAMRAVIRSTVPGQPVPDISKKRLSALMDVSEDEIDIRPVPGRGAAFRLLTVGRPDEDRSPAAVWAAKIAPQAMPGTVLTSARSGRPTARPDEEG